MRIMVKPPSPAPPALRAGGLVTLRVEAADPAPRIDGPVSIAYEGRYADDPSPAFLFPAPAPGPQGVSMRTSAHSPFRLPPESRTDPYVDIPVHEGDVVTATLLADNKTYSAALRAPAPGNNPHQPVEMTLVEGGAAPPPGPPPTPQPAPGLTITPLDGEGDVLTLDPAPGNDNIVVVG
jgi:hypothetical protein